MWVSAKVEYALRTVHHLALHFGEGQVSLREIAEEQGIPLKFLEQILAELKNAGLVESKRGAHGGYCLRREPREVRVAHVVRAIEGSFGPVGCVEANSLEACSRMSRCGLGWLWWDVKLRVDEVLEGTTFEEVCRRTKLEPSTPLG